VDLGDGGSSESESTESNEDTKKTTSGALGTIFPITEGPAQPASRGDQPHLLKVVP
jgi:hypothetical protein